MSSGDGLGCCWFLESASSSDPPDPRYERTSDYALPRRLVYAVDCLSRPEYQVRIDESCLLAAFSTARTAAYGGSSLIRDTPTVY